jgi:hypothetical protein
VNGFTYLGENQSAALKRWQQTGHDELSFAPFFCFREVSVRCVYDGLGDLMACLFKRYVSRDKASEVDINTV